MRTELHKGPRPRGILILMYLSVIVGGFLTYAGFLSTPETEKQLIPEIIPGYTLGFLQVLGYILIAIGIMYIGMGIGFWKGNVWALKLYKYEEIIVYTIGFIRLSGYSMRRCISSKVGARSLAAFLTRLNHKQFFSSLGQYRSFHRIASSLYSNLVLWILISRHVLPYHSDTI